jgi:hypothetical protein
MEAAMRTFARRYTWAVFAVLFTAFAPAAAWGQDATQQEVSAQQLAAYVKAFAEIGQARDEAQAKLAASPNKTIEAQQQLRETLKLKSTEIIKSAGLTIEQYTRITWLISIDEELRASFEQELARISAEKKSGG